MTALRAFETLRLYRETDTPYLRYSFWVDRKRTRRSTRETRIEPAWRVARDAYEAAKLRASGREPEPTLAGLVDQWVQAHRLILSDDHVDGVERWGRLHVASLRDLRLSQITTPLVEQARLAYLETHSLSSARQWTITLALLFNWAIRDRRMIHERPWRVTAIKPQKAPKPRLDPSKSLAFLEAVDRVSRDPALRMAIRLMLGLGLRCESEALRARWDWLDTVRWMYTPGFTKGKEAWERPVPEWLRPALMSAWRPTGYIIPDRRGRLLTRRRIQGALDKACRLAGIARITAHALRHHYATELSESGVPIQDIQRVLAHKDLRTTISYLGVDLSRVVRGQARMAERLGLNKVDGMCPTACPNPAPALAQSFFAGNGQS